MRLARVLILALSVVSVSCAQQFKFSLDRLAAKASNTVDLSLNGATLQFAAKFLDGKDKDQAQVKKLLGGLEGVYVKTFEFSKAGEWTEADLDSIRKQLQPPQWSRIVGVKSSQSGERSEIYVRNDDKKISGVAIIAAEAKELTIVNIAGSIDLDSLAQLGGHMGIPKVDLGNKK
jgi:hypothetical protein